MKTQKICRLLALVFVAASAAGCHSAEPATTAATPPPAQVKQNAVQMQEYQISHSNLPPDQKTRLIDQIRAGGK